MYITRQPAQLNAVPMTANFNTNAGQAVDGRPKPLQVALPTQQQQQQLLIASKTQFSCGYLSTGGDGAVVAPGSNLSCSANTPEALAKLTKLHGLILAGLEMLGVPPLGRLFFTVEQRDKRFGRASVEAIVQIVKAALPYMQAHSDLTELASITPANVTLEMINKFVSSSDTAPIIEECIKAYSLGRQATPDGSTPQIDVSQLPPSMEVPPIERQELAPVAKSNKKLWFGIIGGVLVAGTIGLIFFKSRKR